MPSTKRLSDVGGAKPTKRPRSSLSRSRNTAWDFAPQQRRAGVKQEATLLGQRGAFGSLIMPYDEDADVDEAAAALLAMSCPPQPLPQDQDWSPPASPRKRSSVRRRSRSGPMPPDSSFQFPAAPVEVHGSSLPVYPRLIISSKSNASEESSATMELKTAAGGSTESIQSTGELIHRSRLAEALASGGVDNPSGRQTNPMGELHHRLQQTHSYSGPTISTGGGHAKASTYEKQASGARPTYAGVKAGGFPPIVHQQIKSLRPGKSAAKEAPPVHYTLKPSSSASHAGLVQPAVRSRGGRLIVLPDNPTSSQGGQAGGGNPLQRQPSSNLPVHPPWQAPLVLAKPSQPRLQTTATPLQRAGSCYPHPNGPKQITTCQHRLVTIKSDPGMAAAFRMEKGKWGLEEARTGAQEGGSEDSSEEVFQPGWGLTLFSALNPHVITTGLSIADQGRSTSQPLDAK